MNFLGLGAQPELKIEFKDQHTLKQVSVKRGDEVEKLYLFSGFDTIAGLVTLTVPAGKRYEHTGIKIELIGQIELAFDRSNNYVFTSLVRDLEVPGTLTENKTYPFEFANVEKQYETYSGINVRLRYFVRVRLSRPYLSDIKDEVDFAVQNVNPEPEINNTIKMEVGIEDCLHIEFEYNKSKYHLEDVVIGKIYFLLVRIKIKHMELQILTRESTGSGPNTYNETVVLTKFEIMDGAPMRGESIPIRLFLNNFDLTPTFKNVHNKFNVKYYLNLVLVDEEERRYFKQQEIQLWRKQLKASEESQSMDTPSS
eukprot:TRINITY_DN1159_c0_g1_i12.p2 TRINITY_DN1159_c0_g1~~TRINITY_DN1159_c0_g1_i12.p2  ORF type:complete len:311 (+),score=121.51 TRINITY_DN1159_c0_g1_i12:97-1029(+)